MADLPDHPKPESAAAQLAAFVQSSEDAIISKDLDGTVTSWNHGAEQLFGYTAVEMIGHSIVRIIPPARLQEETEILERIRHGESVRHFETVRQRKDGRTLDISVTISAIKDGSGKIVGASKVARDITEAKRAAAAAARLAAIIQSSDDAIIGKDLAGTVTSWNSGAELLFGYTAEEMIGQPITRLIPAERLAEETEILDRIRRGENVRHFETVRQRKDGRRIEISVTTSPIKNADGVVVGASKVARDITERKKTEAALAQAREQTQVLARRLIDLQETERRQLARDLHDELGQTLTALKINLLNVLPKSAAGGSPLPSIVLLDRALQHTHSLSLALRPPLLDDLGLLPALRWLVDQQSQQTGRVITLAAKAGMTRTLPEIETACFRIAQEAITNALRHAQARTIAVRLDATDRELRLKVRDDGTGFDHEESRARAVRGGSLGLLGMHERALLAGGTIEWISAPATGSNVIAIFPLEKKIPDQT